MREPLQVGQVWSDCWRDDGVGATLGEVVITELTDDGVYFRREGEDQHQTMFREYRREFLVKFRPMDKSYPAWTRIEFAIESLTRRVQELENQVDVLLAQAADKKGEEV